MSYYGDSSLVASYSYQAPNIGDGNGAPLLANCDDPMFSGPMGRIHYVYATGTNVDGSTVVYGQILSENSNLTGQAVSTLTINTSDARTETRGDGSTRSFNYSNAKLVNYTDFKGHTSYIEYDGNGYTSAFTDARGHKTTTTTATTMAR